MFGIEIPDIGNIDIAKLNLRQALIDFFEFMRDFLKKLTEAFSSIKTGKAFEFETLPPVE